MTGRLPHLLFFLLIIAAAPAAPADSRVRVSPRDARYLELSSGAPFIPIGLNLIAPPAGLDEDAAFRLYESWLKQLSANGGNFIRVWLSHPFWDVEHARSGQFDELRAKRIDRLLELCRRYKIRVKFTLEHFRTIGGGRQSWADKPLHHAENGGPAASIADFFDGEAARAQFRRKIAWYQQRFGDRPEIFGWELWNEMDTVAGGDYFAWTALMLPALREAFPGSLVMQSLGSFDTENKRDRYRRHSLLPGNDLAQVHRYLDLGAALDVCHGPMDAVAASAVRDILAFGPGKPVLLAESGAVEPRHSGPFKLYSADKEGVIFHDTLFAPFFAGAAGPGHPWHWDSYIAANSLWRHFRHFAEAVRGIDPAAKQFEPVYLDQDQLRIYALRGRKNVLIWVRDAQNTWISELRDGQPPALIEGVSLFIKDALPPRPMPTVRIYDPWSGKTARAPLRKGSVPLPPFRRSLVLRVPI
ncbi:MAG: hypothetical protein M9894_38805 [Planctomycetes bacterium]|nr:hypothetical protein [Planctomycetota bacterium]